LHDGFPSTRRAFEVTLYGMWVQDFANFAHMKARALQLPRWYLGIAFGEQVITARGRRTVGAMIMVSRRGQQFDADGRGSDVVIVTMHRSENGLVPGRILDAVLLLRGAPVGATVWPNHCKHISRSDPRPASHRPLSEGQCSQCSSTQVERRA
jgi:hypothetical protein